MDKDKAETTWRTAHYTLGDQKFQYLKLERGVGSDTILLSGLINDYSDCWRLLAGEVAHYPLNFSSYTGSFNTIPPSELHVTFRKGTKYSPNVMVTLLATSSAERPLIFELNLSASSARKLAKALIGAARTATDLGGQ